MMMMRATLALALLLGTPAAAQQVSLVGKKLPKLLLTDEMVQGKRFTQADFAGKVVYLEIFQHGCKGCIEHGMPFLQQIYRTYRYDPNAMVVCLCTAYEKGKQPWRGDLTKIRAYLTANGYTMPVARDKDEASVQLFKRSAPHGAVVMGTPMGVVVDEKGTVIAHEWTGGPAPLRRMKAAFSGALNRLAFPPLGPMPASLKPAAQAYRKAELGRAWVLAGQAKGSSDEVLRGADALRARIERFAKARIARVRAAFEQDPPGAIANAEMLVARLRGMPAATALATDLKGWKTSPRVVALRARLAELQRIQNTLGRKDHVSVKDARRHAGSLRAIVRGTAGTVVAEQARAMVAKIELLLGSTGYPGFTLAESGPLRVLEISAGGPAASAGLRKGDVIVAWNGSETATLAALVRQWKKTKPGDAVVLKIERGGARREVTLTLAVYWQP